MSIGILKVTARIGARVGGVRLARPLGARTVAALREALNTHKALVFDDVRPDDAGQETFARRFGVTFVLNPPRASTLRGITVPPYGGETLIANAAAACRDLPEPLRRPADTLWAEHTNDYTYAVPEEAVDEEEATRRAQFTPIRYRTAHPVVRAHPPPSSRPRSGRGPPSGRRRRVTRRSRTVGHTSG
ncbi:TauD/TfdA family dioxygenase [Streptomyces sp. NPDC004042]|uniref:TauD/TfdA dioxygenase family protein n=1 Tax=Streptomyces sp. NPDC004042 TaxID=3154451 RepID=UPI0033AC05AF